MKELKTSGVYQIVNTKNGHSYVGSSANIHSRWLGHKQKLRKNKHHSHYLQNAWNKYGEENFIIKVLQSNTKTKIEQFEAERKWYNKLKPEYSVGSVFYKGVPLPPEDSITCQKQICPTCKGVKDYKSKECRECSKVGMSKKHSGKNNPSYGNSHSKASRKKMSKSQTGRKHSEKTKQKILDNNPQRKSITIDGVTYSSYNKAAKAIGVSAATITYRVKKGIY